jgi:hypothetical protein
LHACQTGRYSRGRCQAAPCQQGYVRCPFYVVFFFSFAGW